MYMFRSFLGIANFVFCQWFFFRIMKTWNIGEAESTGHYRLMGFVVPMTGWWTPYRYLGKPRGVRLVAP